MKYIFSVSLLLFTMLGVVAAQDQKTGDEYKNEGNEALRGKDYQTALTAYESAISAWQAASEEVDSPTLYNTATCARKLKNYDKAIKYFGMSKEAGYKDDISTYYTAMMYKSQGKSEEMISVLEDGIKEFPNSKYVKNMKKQVGLQYVKDANVYFTNGVNLLNTRTEANSDQWDAIKAKASTEFSKATDLADKALAYDANNETAKTIKTKVTALLAQ